MTTTQSTPAEPEKSPGSADDQPPPGPLEGFELTNHISHLLRRAHFRAEAVFDDVMSEYNLTPRQKSLLATCYRLPGATVNELADGIALDRTSTTEMIGRLVKRGLVERTRSDTDRRAWAITLTPAGLELLRAAVPDDLEVERVVLEPLPEEYRPLFRRCLRIITGLEP